MSPDTKYLVKYGYWAWEGIGELLPFEFLPDDKLHLYESQQDYPKKNGFVLKDLRIPIDKIMRGGPPKDGIPALTDPSMLTADKAGYLGDNDMVLGLSIGGVEKAYPIKILNWHELVNDQLGDTNVVVTFCPLCGSGIAFDATFDGKRKLFGVSGLLYNSDVLLYDKATESLWSQLLMESVSGELSGKKLNPIHTELTSWSKWKTDYPKTKVLSNITKYPRDYNLEPYSSYLKSEVLMFPVDNRDQRFSAKERVIGIEVDGKYRAYPFSELAKSGAVSEIFNGTLVEITFDVDNGISHIKANPKVTSLVLFWFAWYTFHTETEVYLHK